MWCSYWFLIHFYSDGNYVPSKEGPLSTPLDVMISWSLVIRSGGPTGQREGVQGAHAIHAKLRFRQLRLQSADPNHDRWVSAWHISFKSCLLSAYFVFLLHSGSSNNVHWQGQEQVCELWNGARALSWHGHLHHLPRASAHPSHL